MLRARHALGSLQPALLLAQPPAAHVRAAQHAALCLDEGLRDAWALPTLPSATALGWLQESHLSASGMEAPRCTFTPAEQSSSFQAGSPCTRRSGWGSRRGFLCKWFCLFDVCLR